MNRFLKCTLPMILISLLITGCLTEDYNLRVIKDTRNMSSADTLANRISWNDEDWLDEHADQWSSAGVIITDDDNSFFGETEAAWLGRIIDQGFKGQILIEVDFDWLPTSWFDVGGYREDVYTDLVAVAPMVKDIVNSTVLFNHPTYGYSFMLNPVLVNSTGWGDIYGDYISAYSDSLMNWIGADSEDVSIGIFLPYKQSYWRPYDEYPSEMTTLNADPLDIDISIDQYSAPQLTSFNGWAEHVMYSQRTSNVDVVVYGDLLDLDLDALTTRSIKGVFFEDITTDNYQAMLTTVATYRTAYTPVNEYDSILMIAGVTLNEYQEPEPVQYGQMINTFVQNAVYFTPGANGDYFDYPDFKSGDWWIRTNNDAEWYGNPNNPTYSNYTTHPRKLYGVALVQPTRASTSSFPLGGHTWGSAIGHNNQYWALGGDVSGTWTSRDGGVTWELHNQGIANERDAKSFYTRDIIAVKNDSFEGFILTNDTGIWYLEIPFQAETPWTNMIDVENVNYLSYTHHNWGDWLENIPFCSIDWDGNNLLTATTGRNRYNSTEYELYYPWNVADGDSLTQDLTAASWSGGAWGDNIFGKVGLWKYDFTTPGSGWHPVEGSDSYLQKYGRYKDVDVAIVGTDTLYGVATSAGPKLLTVSGASKVWDDIDNNSWGDVNQDQIDKPIFTTKADTKTLYHYAGPDGVSSIGDGHITVIEVIRQYTPSIGTVTMNGVGYPYTSWTGSTFDITGTVTNETPKGYSVTEPTDSQACWSIMVTNRGEVYCVVSNTDQTWNGDSGCYQLQYGTGTWFWVGDDTGVQSTEGFQDITTSHNLSVAEFGVGAWNARNPMYPQFAIGSYQANTFSGRFVTVTGHEGTGATPDTLYLGGNFSFVTVRGLVPDGVTGPQNTTWVPIITRDYTFSPAESKPYPDLARHGSIPSNWALNMIHKMAMDPNNVFNIFATPSDYIYASTDGGDSWRQAGWTLNPEKREYLKATGVDEQCINGITVLSDGRLITSRGDVYPSITIGTDWSWNTRFTPLGADGIESCWGNDNDDIMWGPECGGIISFKGWNGQNPDDDYILFNNGDIIQIAAPSKMFLIHDDDGDGQFVSPGEWLNISDGLIDSNKYIYKSNIVTDGINKIWMSYILYSGIICDDKGSVVKYGVIEYYWDGVKWIYTDIDQPSIAGWGIVPTKLAYDATGNRLWMISPFEGNGGGTYMCDLDDVTPTWLAVVGEGAVAPYAAYEPLGAMGSLRMSDDNTHVYFGSNGGSGKVGAIWRVTNAQAATNSFIVEQVVNTTGVVYHPEFTETSTFLDSRGGSWDTTNEISQRMCDVTDILIDPLDNNRIWFTQAGNLNRLSTFQGLYALDITNNEIVHMFPDDPRSNLVDTRGGISLLYTESTPTPRILWGTHCIGVSYFEYNGLFPTGNYGEGDGGSPPIEMMMSMDPPIFSDEPDSVVFEPVPTAVEGAPVIDMVYGLTSSPTVATLQGSFGPETGTVELADNQFYDQATVKFESTSISWMDDTVLIMSNLGTFIEGDTVYLFVTSADGKVSLPYEKKIGQ